MTEQGTWPYLTIRRWIDAGACLAALLLLSSLAGPVVTPIPAIGIAALPVALVLLALLGMVLLASGADILERVEVLILVMACISVTLQVLAVLHFSPPYQTDEAALLQAAGALVLHGHNPYGVDLARAYSTFHVSPYRVTPLASGGFVTQINYPGLAVLIAAATVWVTDGYQAIVAASTAALIVATITCFALLPKAIRSLAIVASLALPGLVGDAIGGLIAVLAIPFLVFAVWRWDAIGEERRLGRMGIAQATALGLACSVSQLAWLIAPFLIVLVWRRRSDEDGFRRGSIVCLHFGLVAAATFALCNVAFMVANPPTWLAGVGAPILQHSIPLGFGLAALPSLAGVGGGFLAGYSMGAACLYLALLATLWAWFERLRYVALILPVLATLVSTRALTEYWILLIPVWLVAAATVGVFVRDSAKHSVVGAGRAGTAAKVLAAALVLAGASVIGLSVASPAPFAVIVSSFPARDADHVISAMTVQLKNRSDQALTPHFIVTVQIGTSVWLVRHGPHRLAPNQSASYLLVPPNRKYEIPATQVQVGVLTNDPETVSLSPLAFPGRQ